MNGALAVEVSGSQRGSMVWKANKKNAPLSSKQWKENFQSLEHLRQAVPLFGKQIADDL